MIDFDVNLEDAAAANIDVRRHKNDKQGRLMGTNNGYKRLGGGGNPNRFAAEQTYTGTMAVKRLSNGREIAGSLSQGGRVLTAFSLVDDGSEVNNFGMLAFHVNSKTFGFGNKVDAPDNRLDFSHFKLEVLP